MGAKVMFCGHAGWFMADIFDLGPMNVIKANGPITTDNIIRTNISDATHHVSDYPQRGFWCPERGVLVVRKAQCRKVGAS